MAGRPVWALVILTSADTSSRPADDPGWDYVGARGRASAVYLGDRWVLTAFHAGAGSVTLLGESYAKEPGEGIQLRNPPGFGLSTFTDLRMFRLESDPGLPRLDIGVTRPPIWAEVTMIGFGRTATGDPTSWNVDNSGDWVEGPGPYLGFKLGDSAKRWGTNRIDGTAVLPGDNGDVLSFRAEFNQLDSSNEARAAAGDSGGGLFYKRGDHWQLLGIMQSTSSEPGQPGDVAVLGNTTNSADLTLYRSQILDIIGGSTDPDLWAWQNPVNALDVNRDSRISPIDALLVINELNAPFYSELKTGALPVPPMEPDVPPPFLDVSGDDRVTPNDAVRVINELNLYNGGLTADRTVVSAVMVTALVPEPATWVLAVLAGIGALFCGRW